MILLTNWTLRETKISVLVLLFACDNLERSVDLQTMGPEVAS